MRREIRVPTRPVLAHSADAVSADGLLFVAGVLPLAADGSVVGATAAEQAVRVFDDLGSVLTAGGCGFGDVATMNVFLTDLGDLDAFASVQRSTFGEARPASTVVEVGALAIPGSRIEVDAIAVIP